MAKEINTVRNFLSAIKDELNVACTENGALAYATTKDSNLDLFGSIASLRQASDSHMANIFRTFNFAYEEDKVLATRMLFWLRDVRGGAGERETFRKFLVHLANSNKNRIVKANIYNIAEYGRFDDMLCLLETPLRADVLQYIDNQLNIDAAKFMQGEEISLLAKWLPSENASSKETIKNAKIIRKYLGLTPKQYRIVLTKLRGKIKIVETPMSANKWDTIEYSKVPAKAGMRYASAFLRHDEERYDKYLEDVAIGKIKINASTLFPYDIVHQLLYRDTFSYRSGPQAAANKVKDKTLNLLWNNLPDYLNGSEENILCMVDTSGSMTGYSNNKVAPLDIAISLGIYTAERNHGVFHNKFLTFSRKPELQSIVGETIADKVSNLSRAHWDMNTNIESAFMTILNAAIRSQTNPKDMISKLIIISDMQFDYATNRQSAEVFMKTMKRRYEDAGYKLPSLVYWNVSARSSVVHSTKDDVDFCMVSGASPSIFKGVLNGDIEVEVVDKNGNITTETRIDPMKVMYETLITERYNKVVVV